MGCGASTAGAAPAQLTQRLKSPDPVVRDKAVRAIGDLKQDQATPFASDLALLLSDQDRGVRSAVVCVLPKLGPGAAAACPHIAACLGDADAGVQYAAETVLAGLKADAAPAVPHLRTVFDKGDDFALIVMRVLRTVGAAAEPFAPAAAKRLRDERSDIRKAAVALLLALAASHVWAAKEVEAVLPGAADAACLAALEVLQAYGEHASPAAMQLVPLLSHGNSAVREAAQGCLDKLAQAGALVPDSLAVLLADTQVANRLAAARLAASLTALPAASPLATALGRGLGDDDAAVRSAVRDALRVLPGEVAAAALRELPGLSVLSGDEQVCLDMLQLIEDLGKSAEPAAAEIPKALAHGSSSVRERALEVLGALAELGLAAGASAGIYPLLESDDTVVRLCAGEALRKLGRKNTGGSAQLAQLLASPRYDVRKNALESLEAMGPQAAGAAPYVAELLASDQAQVREFATKVLCDLREPMAAATPALLELMTHRKDYTRYLAASVLRDFGDLAVPQVTAALAQDDWQARRRALEQLGKLGLGCERFVAAISERLGDEVLEVRIAAGCLVRALAAAAPGAVPEAALALAEELVAASLRTHGTPKYWTNSGSDFDEMVYVDKAQHPKFDELLRETYLARATQDRLCPKGEHKKTPGGCPCVQPGGDPGLPVAYRTRRVIRVENALMWSRYVMKRDAIRIRRTGDNFKQFDPPVLSMDCVARHSGVFAEPDAALNEVYLFHGTFVRAAVSIAKMDFRIDLAGSSTGTMYGRGAYLGECITKADEYATDEPGGYYENVFAVLVCRTCMGKLYYTTKRDEGAGDAVARGDFDSTLGDRAKTANTFRELVVYDNDQLYPEYIVVYQRVLGSDSEEQIQRSLSVPVSMELPVYWTNCYKKLQGDTFNDRFDARDATVQALQRLVASCSTSSSWKVTGARRVENSALWSRMSTFRSSLRARSGGVSCMPADKLPATQAVATQRHLSQEPLEQVLCADSLDVVVNEHFLWHGTSPEVAESIASDGFRISQEAVQTSGLRYGSGAYFAELLDKVLPYAQGEGNTKCVLLCRVICGQFYLTEVADAEAVSKASSSGKDCVLAFPYRSEPREFIVWDSAQIYPEFIVELQPS